MSLVATSSIRALAGSVDGTLGGRLQEPVKLASNAIFGRFLTTPERHERIACGHPTIAPATSPADDINKTLSMLGEINARASGNGA